MGQRTEQGILSRHRRLIAVAAGVAVVSLVIGFAAFEPWRLWTRSTVTSDLPTVAAVEPAAPAEPAGPAAPARARPSAPSAPIELAAGKFVTQEHATSGTARVLELADGSRYLRLQDFSTSDGPDLHVWLTDQAAGGSWGKYDDGRYLRLGELQGTDGDQNYRIPAGADLAGLTSVVIWCDRFNVAFGSAPLAL